MTEISTNAPTCPYHGSLARLNLATAASLRDLAARRRRRDRLNPGHLERAANRKLDELGPAVAAGNDRALDDLDRTNEVARCFEVADEVGQRRQGEAAALEGQRVAALLDRGEPGHVGQ